MHHRWMAALGLVLAASLACTPAAAPTPTGLSTPPASATPTELSSPPVTATLNVPQPTSPPPVTPPLTPPATDEPLGSPPPLAFEPVAEGFGDLTLLAHAGDGSGLVYVVEQRGVIRVGSPGGELNAEPFLDISDRVDMGGERGLLGLAFHPGFATSGRFFVNYSNLDGHNVIAEFHAAAGGRGGPADATTEREILVIEQPFGNHNGGMLAFGQDGMLYISSGDGGAANDPFGAGQDLTTLLGKVLRIDVDGDEPYAIPPDNPFAAAQDGSRPEVWAYGLRNPWRITFDRLTGALFIADVGQGTWEEINAEPPGAGGRNYGWNIMEGPDCFEQVTCETAGLTLPVAWYETGEGCAVTGGYVYRGAAIPALAGFYLFADYCSGNVWAIDAGAALDPGERPLAIHELGDAGINVTGFGEDEAGEVYLVGAGGEVLRVVAGD